MGRAIDEVQSLASSPDGKNFYAAAATRTDAFATTSSNGIAVFSRDPATGALTQLPGTAGCVTDDGSGGSCADGRALVDTRGVAVSPDGMHVYAAAGGAGSPTDFGSIVAFARDPGTGALTQLAGTAGCLTLGGGGPDGCGSVRGLSKANSIAVNNASVYVTASAETAGSESLVVLSRDATTGALTQLSGTDGCISDTGADGLSGTTCTDGRAMYEPKDVVVTKDGNNVYLAVSEAAPPSPHGPGAVAVFARDAGMGKLTQLAGTNGCLSKAAGETCADARGLRDAISITVSPDDLNVYVAAQGASPVTGPGTLVVLTRDPATGVLTQPAGTKGCLTADGTDGTGQGGPMGDCATVSTGFAEPTDVTVSPDGATAYVATSDDHTLTAFSRAGDGALTPIGGGCLRHGGGGGCASGRALKGATSVVALPNCGDVYVASTSDAPADPSIAALATCRPVATATVAACSQSGDVPISVSSPTPGRSGAAVRYRIAGGDEQRAAATGGVATINVPEGRNSLEYWGEDTAGIEAADHPAVTVLVDRSGPTLTIVSGQGKNSFRLGERATVNITASDENSGLTSDPSARDVVLATDKRGTFSVARTAVDACGNQTAATFTYSVKKTCTDRLPPITKLGTSGVAASRRSVRLSGRSKDRGRPCRSGLKKVEVSLAKVSGRTGVNCRFLRSRTTFALTERRNCRRPVLFTATGRKRWQFQFDLRLPPGLYRTQARATDQAGNKETPKKRRNIVFFEAR